MITFIQNDTGPRLIGDINASLVGATAVVLHFRQPRTDTILTRNASVTDAPNGIWEYHWGAAELATTGVWAVETQVTFSNGEIQTFGPQNFRVDPEIG